MMPTVGWSIREHMKITKDVILVNNEVSTKIWGCSSAGRAPALQAGGQEFDSPHLHQFKQFHAHFAFFLSLAYRCTRRRQRKSELHANLFEFKINIKDCTLKTKQCNKR